MTAFSQVPLRASFVLKRVTNGVPWNAYGTAAAPRSFTHALQLPFTETWMAVHKNTKQ